MPFFESMGIGFNDDTIHNFLSMAEFVDKTNFSSLWIQEGDRRSALALAAIALRSTIRVKVGIGVTSPFRRHPQILAIESATLNEASDGRFMLGLGVASGAMKNYGLRTNPLHAMQDAFMIIRGLLSDDASQFSYSGAVFSINKPQKRLNTPSLPIYMGAIGSRMLDLAGEIADGLITTRRGSFSLEYTKYAIQRVIKSALRHNRDPNTINFLGFFETCISENGDLARQFAKRILGTYTIPELPTFVSDLTGISEREIQTVKQRYGQGDVEGAISAVTDDMVDIFAIAGTPAQCVRKLEQFTKTGLKTPILYIHGPDKKNAAKLAAEQIVPKLTCESRA